MCEVRAHPVRKREPAVAVTSPFRFIQPCNPVTAKSVPAGNDWVYEVDGDHVQAHKVSSRVILFSRYGHDFTERFAAKAQLPRELPARSAVLDGEIVANDSDGRQNFARLQLLSRESQPVHLRAFDLLALNRPGSTAAAAGEAPSVRAGPPGTLRPPGCLALSEPFDDGQALLRVAEQRGVERVVSKRRDAPYRSGECRDWLKVKTATWREANPRVVAVVRSSCR
jgi:bifunctional non-homologous end joining protein LigD